MEDKIFNVGYTTYLSKKKIIKKRWTSKILTTVKKHKILTLVVGIIMICFIMNTLLIYQFIRIIELNKIL